MIVHYERCLMMKKFKLTPLALSIYCVLPFLPCSGTMVLGAEQLSSEDQSIQYNDKNEPIFYLDPIIVIASPVSSPLKITLDPKQPKQPIPASDATDYLKSIPGFSAVRTGGTNGDTVFRGMFGSRLNILTNGGNMYGGCGGRMDAPASYISPELYDRVTVIKGPQTVLWGGGASAATIRFDRLTENYTEQGARAKVGLLAGSNDRLDQTVDASLGDENAYVRFTGNHAKSADYKDGDGNTIPSKWKKWNTDVTLGWTPSSDTLIEFTGGIGNGYARYADRSMDGIEFKRESFGTKLVKNNLTSNLENLELQYYYNYADHVMDNYGLRPEPKMRMSNNPSRIVHGGRFVLDWLLGDSHTLITGIDAQTDEHRSRSGLGNRESHPWNRNLKFNKYGLFEELTSNLNEKNKIISGLRLDQVEVKDYRLTSSTKGEKRTDMQPSGFIRFEQTLKDPSSLWYAGLGYTERFPDFWEINQSVVKNSYSNAFNSLQSEKTTQIDIGFQHKSQKSNFWLSAYAGTVTDYILFDYGKDKSVQNVDTRIMGAELGLAYQLTEHFKFDSSIAYSWGKNVSDHQPLPQIPPLEARFGLNYDQENWQAGLLWRVVAPQNRVALDKGNVKGKDFNQSAGFGILSANGNIKLAKSMMLSVGIDNILNKTYSEHLNTAGSLLWGFPANKQINEPGRTYWVKANFDF